MAIGAVAIEGAVGFGAGGIVGSFGTIGEYGKLFGKEWLLKKAIEL